MEECLQAPFGPTAISVLGCALGARPARAQESLTLEGSLAWLGIARRGCVPRRARIEEHEGDLRTASCSFTKTLSWKVRRGRADLPMASTDRDGSQSTLDLGGRRGAPHRPPPLPT